MALKIIDHGTAEYQRMIKLRDEILRKPLGLTFTPDELEKEKYNLHIAAYNSGSCIFNEEGRSKKFSTQTAQNSW